MESILDSGWHKLALSVQQRAASLHVDCSSIQTKPLEPRGELSTKGHTLLGIRATDAAAVEVWRWRARKGEDGGVIVVGSWEIGLG